MAQEINEKVILITGASSGIGAATALAFDRAGAKVTLAARRKDLLDRVAADMKDPLILQVDISKEDEVRKMVIDVVQRFGRIDVLINNAASIIVAQAEVVTQEDLLEALHTNFLGPVTATQEAVVYMKRQGGGQIINVGSPGFMLGVPFYTPYVCSKAALCAWTRTIQAEWAGNGIIVSEFFPGYVLTGSKPLSRIGEVGQDFLMSMDQNWLSRTFTRPKSPEDIAKRLVNLVSRPRTLAYSGFSVKLGVWISNISGFRLSLARSMARTARDKMDQH